MILYPHFIVIFLQTNVRLRRPADVFRLTSNSPVRVTPSFRLHRVLISNKGLLIRILCPHLRILMRFRRDVNQRLFVRLFFQLFIYRNIRTLGRVLMRHALLRRLLRNIIRLTTLPFRGIRRTRFPSLYRGYFMLLVVRGRHRLLRFHGRTSTSFLFS